MKFVRLTPAMPLALAILGAGCAGPRPPVATPLEYERSPASDSTLSRGPASAARPTQTTVSALPRPPELQAAAQQSQETPRTPTPRDKEEVSMAIEQTPLPMFIQILYGNVLKRPYSIDQAVNTRTDLVTFKTTQPITVAKMEQLAVNLLRSYGLSVYDYGGVVRVSPDSSTTGMLPQLRRGKALPETPEPLRPVFQHVELEAVRSSDVAQWLKQILGTRVNVIEDTQRNGFMLSGTQADLRAATELIESLDQPRMRGRVARRITPAFAGAGEFGTRLSDMLGAQGYSVSNSPSTPNATILVIPIPAIGSVVVFTSTDSLMEHVLRWARELDRPPVGQGTNSLFTYAVKYADAQELARTLGELLGGGGGGGSTPAPAPAQSTGPLGSSGGSGGSPARSSSSGGNGRIVVNNATNTLIIRGSTAEEYQQIMALLRELDRPTKSALVEVVIAEVTTSASRQLGIDWTYAHNGGLSGSTHGSLVTAGDNAGFNLSLINNPRTLIATLKTLAANNQAHILSSPKIVARNGETASISVGDEVPIITSQQSTGTVSTGLFASSQPGVIQQVQYRSTGMLLRVRPIINSGNRLDLDVSQEVSEPKKTVTGVSASPTISTRRIETKLSLRDGSTVLLGGLIRRSSSQGNAGIPWLKDIPAVGALFGAQSTDSNETELMIVITPYVINDDYEAESITDAVQSTFGDWVKEVKPTRRLPPRGTTEAGSPPAPAPSSEPAAPDEPITAPPVAPEKRPTPSAPVPRSSATPDDGGIVTSRPAAAAPAPAATPAPADGSAPKATAPASSAAPSQAPIQGGKQVDDAKVKEDIQKLLQKR